MFPKVPPPSFTVEKKLNDFSHSLTSPRMSQVSLPLSFPYVDDGVPCTRDRWQDRRRRESSDRHPASRDVHVNQVSVSRITLLRRTLGAAPPAVWFTGSLYS